MNRIASSSLLVLASLLATGAAQAQDHKYTATVPFEFNVADKAMPAGHYIISEQSPNILLVRSTDHNAAVLSSIFSDGTTAKDSNKMVFTRYGNTWCLSKVLTTSSSTSVDLPISKRMKQQRREEVAAGGTAPTETLVALR